VFVPRSPRPPPYPLTRASGDPPAEVLSGQSQFEQGAPSCHRTNTCPIFRQTATRVSDRSRYRRLACRNTVLETVERMHLRSRCRRRPWVRLHREGRPKVRRVFIVLTVFFVLSFSAFADMSTGQGGGMMGGGWGWGMNSGWVFMIIIAILVIFGIAYMMKRK